MGANDRVRLGIVGIGGRGNAHLRSYVQIPDAQVAGLCDVNQAARERAQAQLLKASQPRGKEYVDMRELFADKNIDAVSIATPNHWHALATIWACEAGKDVYVEKPASHNIYEGWRMVEVARKTNRMVQVGQQSRSTPHKMKAMQLLKDGVIGELYMAKALCFKRRKSIGKTPEEAVPPGLDWDKFLGPAPMRKYTKNRFAYNWHWFWDTGNGAIGKVVGARALCFRRRFSIGRTPDEPVPAGVDWDKFLGPAQMKPYSLNKFNYNWHWFWDTGNGDIGNQGVHEFDIARWGLGDVAMPKSVVSTGGKFVYDDDQETPNTQLATLVYPKAQLVFEVRGLLTGGEGPVPVRGGNVVGNLFYGADGWMWVEDDVIEVYKGEKNEKAMEERRAAGDGTVRHMQNFLAACRSRKHTDLTCDIEVGATSAALCHLANVSYRAGRKLDWDGAKKKFVNAPDADKLITREYRRPYVV
jgi:predicted dehydrogenase